MTKEPGGGPPVALSLVLVCVLASHQPASADDVAPSTQTITLTINYGDGVQKTFTKLPWHTKLTVLDATTAASKHPRGIRFDYRGSGSTALLTSIDDVENQGGKEKNWVYRINGKLAPRSFGVQKLSAGDAVLWKFEEYP